jgi:hypothetical protein
MPGQRVRELLGDCVRVRGACCIRILAGGGSGEVAPTPAPLRRSRAAHRAALDVLQAKLHIVSTLDSGGIWVRLQLLSLEGGAADAPVLPRRSCTPDGIVLHTGSGVHIGLFDPRAAAARAEELRLAVVAEQRRTQEISAQIEGDEWFALLWQIHDVHASGSWGVWRCHIADTWGSRPPISHLVRWLQPCMAHPEWERIGEAIIEEAGACRDATFRHTASGRAVGFQLHQRMLDALQHWEAHPGTFEAALAGCSPPPLPPQRDYLSDHILYTIDRDAYYASLAVGVGDGDDASSSLDESDTCSDFTPSSAPYFSSHLETLSSPSLLPRGVRWLRSAWREILLDIEEPGGSSELSGLGGDVMRSDFTPFPAPHIPYQLESPLLPPPPLLPSGCVGVAVRRSGGRGDRSYGRGSGRARAGRG